MHNLCTETFKINQGVRQGCVLSPLLFNIFLSDLAKKLNAMEGKVQVHDREVNTRCWADDIIMFTKEENTLREMLETLEEYTNENKLKINKNKTKIMIFNKTGRLMRRCTAGKCAHIYSLVPNKQPRPLITTSPPPPRLLIFENFEGVKGSVLRRV